MTKRAPRTTSHALELARRPGASKLQPPLESGDAPGSSGGGVHAPAEVQMKPSWQSERDWHEPLHFVLAGSQRYGEHGVVVPSVSFTALARSSEHFTEIGTHLLALQVKFV
jgi:hypothetical protein